MARLMSTSSLITKAVLLIHAPKDSTKRIFPQKSKFVRHASSTVHSALDLFILIALYALILMFIKMIFACLARSDLLILAESV